jgi:hypothetical protein
MVSRRVGMPGIILCVFLAPFGAKAQALAETGLMTSKSAITSQAAKPVIKPSTTKPSASLHLVGPAGPPPEDMNRKSFEDKAGQQAGKLLLRSVPSGAEILIDSLPVGRTPLLMIIAPGKYKVDMRGPRQEYGSSVVGLMANETATVAINLSPRYPTSITIH